MRPCGAVRGKTARFDGVPLARRQLPALEVGARDPYLPPAYPREKRSRTMPIYAYECGACGATHDFLQKMSEGRKRKCPSCGGLRLRKLVTAAAFHLKGTGWYVTDFRDKEKEKDKDKDKEKDSDGSQDKKKQEGESKEEPASKSDSSSSSSGDAKSTSSSSKSPASSGGSGGAGASAD